MGLNIPKMGEQERKRRDVEAKALLHFAREIYQFKRAGGRHFLREHPAGARSWADEEMVKLMKDYRVGSVVGHQCQYGQWARGDDGERVPARTATRWLSSAPRGIGPAGPQGPGRPPTSGVGGRACGCRRGLPASIVPRYPARSRGTAAP